MPQFGFVTSISKAGTAVRLTGKMPVLQGTTMARVSLRVKVIILILGAAPLTLLAATAVVQMQISEAVRAGWTAGAVSSFRTEIWLISGAATLILTALAGGAAWLVTRPQRSGEGGAGVALRTALLGGNASREAFLEQEHKRLRDQLFQQEKMVLIGQIAASVAHELNTPLGTILLRSQLVLRQHQDAEELSDLKVIESEAQRCRRIIDSLLSFSRRSEGAMSETDMTSLIEESLSIVGRDLENKGVAVESHHADEAATVCVDPNQIQQVLLNLVANAADAMPDGGTLRISTRSLPERNMLEIRVADTGSGMSPEVLQKAMSPFYTTKPRGKGTGLGLPICQRIVEEHQGEIEIQSRPGEGTVVSVLLPQVASKGSKNG
jgi:signal transduction histidine kinase